MRHLRLGSICLAVALVAVACQQPSTPGAESPGAKPVSQEKVVWVDGTTTPPRGGWLLETNDAFLLSRMGVTEMLTRIDFEGNLKPGLATEWKATSPTTWEFTLRDGVRFHDGSAMDAAAVANALTKLLEAKTPARSFNRSSVKAVEAVGPNKVRITTNAAAPLLPLVVASPNAGILAPKAYQPNRNDPLGNGTGPFVMTKDAQPQSVTLKGNESYWGGKVGLKDVEVRWVSDINTRSVLARSGEAHLVRPIAIASLPQLKSDPSLKVVQGTVPRTTTLYLNNSKPPLKDARVRQAIQAAIDVEAIAKEALEGAVQPAVGPFAPNQPYAPAGAQPVKQDLEKAKRLLAEAGVDPAKLTIGLWTYTGRPELPTAATAIQAMLKRVGISVELRIADYNILEADALAGKHDMFLVSRGYLSDINDPLNYLVADLGCKGGYRLAHFCDQALDEKLATAGTISDTQQRYATYKEVAQRVQSQAVNVFLYHETDITVQTSRLQGLKIHPLDNFLLTPELTLSAK